MVDQIGRVSRTRMLEWRIPRYPVGRIRLGKRILLRYDPQLAKVARNLLWEQSKSNGSTYEFLFKYTRSPPRFVAGSTQPPREIDRSENSQPNRLEHLIREGKPDG